MNLSIKIISLLGTIITAILAYTHIVGLSNCPLFTIIPACYLVEMSFILVFISTFSRVTKKKFILFALGSIFGEVIAIWFSLNEIMGNNYCPKFYGIALCYVSLLTFTTLIVLKFLEYTSDKNQIYEYK